MTTTDTEERLTGSLSERQLDLPEDAGAPTPARKAKRPMNRVQLQNPSAAAGVAKTFAERLTQKRLEKNLTQAEIAAEITFIPKSGVRQGEKCTLSRNAYCMYELGEVEPSLAVIEGLAKVLGVASAWLAFGSSGASASSTRCIRTTTRPAFSRRQMTQRTLHLVK